ncbi:MAG TPA: protein kinase [Polyangiaceae bacterium]|nr:protein kinase [Polyangiaceae bacterium]
MARGLAVEATWIGRTVGSGWIVDSVIGVGGSATVFRATNAEGQSAAIKLMHHQLALSWTKRFEREAKLLQALSHPAIPELYEFGRFGGVPFLVLELLMGQSLDVLCKDARQLDVARIIAYAADALAALEVVHDRGIVHRDLKPSNLLVTDDGVLKVLDFGAAVHVETSLLGPDSLTSGLLGTPAYMPPEQARGRWDMVDHRSDIWSLGAVIFTLLSGEHVHPAQTSNEQLSFAMTRTARSLGRLVPGLSAGLVRVVDRALAYERQERFQSAAEFRAALLGSLRDNSATTRDDACVTVREFRAAPSHSAIDVHRHGPSRVLRRAGWVSGLGACVLAAALIRLELSPNRNSIPSTIPVSPISSGAERPPSAPGASQVPILSSAHADSRPASVISSNVAVRRVAPYASERARLPLASARSAAPSPRTIPPEPAPAPVLARSAPSALAPDSALDRRLGTHLGDSNGASPAGAEGSSASPLDLRR